MASSSIRGGLCFFRKGETEYVTGDLGWPTKGEKGFMSPNWRAGRGLRTRACEVDTEDDGNLVDSSERPSSDAVSKFLGGTNLEAFEYECYSPCSASRLGHCRFLCGACIPTKGRGVVTQSSAGSMDHCQGCHLTRADSCIGLSFNNRRARPDCSFWDTTTGD